MEIETRITTQNTELDISQLGIGTLIEWCDSLKRKYRGIVISSCNIMVCSVLPYAKSVIVIHDNYGGGGDTYVIASSTGYLPDVRKGKVIGKIKKIIFEV